MGLEQMYGPVKRMHIFWQLYQDSSLEFIEVGGRKGWELNGRMLRACMI